MSQSTNPPKIDAWTVYDPDRENAHNFDTRGEAEDRQATAKADFGIDAEVFPPGQLPEGFDAPETDGGQVEAGNETPHETAPTDNRPNDEVAHVAGEDTVDAEVIDHTDDHAPEYDGLPDRNISDDPLAWMPGEYVDVIDGAEAINRKGFEVLAHFYDVDVHVTLQVPPEDTDHEYARVKAVATTPDGRECEAFGSANVERGDDASILLEMADTRARKRALSIATGVGAVAVEELRNEVAE